MLIIIDTSVVTFIKENIKSLNFQSKEIIALNSISMSYYNLEHLIVADQDVLEYLSECNILSELSKLVFCNLLSKYYSFAEYEKKCIYKIVVSKNISQLSRSDNMFYIPLEKLVNISKSILISENLSDCEFYESLGKKMISELEEYHSFNMNFHYITCAGSDAYNVTLNELKENNFCLLIMDTDKDYQDADIGTSLINARKIFNEKKDTRVIELYELQVREKENIVPPSFYLFCSNPPQKNLLKHLALYENSEKASEYLRHLDIKDGIKAKKCKSSDKKWHRLYDEYLMQLESNNLIACSICDVNGKEDNFTLLSGIGDNIVDTFREDILCGGLIKKLQTKTEINVPDYVLESIRMSIEQSKMLFTIIPEYIKKDWQDIAVKVLSWGLCANETEVYLNC